VNSSEPALDRSDGIDVVAMIGVLWRRRWIVIGVTLVGIVASVALALTATKIYRAEVIVTEVKDNPLGGMGGLANQLGGLASIAGLNLPAGDTKTLGVLNSRHLIDEFVRKYDLVPVLTPGTGRPATVWFAVKRFQENVVAVHEDPRKGLTSITMDWTDPVVAAKWANDFVALANELVRARVLQDSTRNVAYLNKQISQTTAVEVQRAMYNLIENETKTLMLANARAEYAFHSVDPAVPPEVRYSPKRALMVLSGTAIGFILGAAIALGFDAWRRRTSGP
jgi:uncharacterized protein involved in exopolysaccharide biosynthesis